MRALQPEDRLLRSWRAGNARYNAYLEDYAALILGLLALYQSEPNPRWYDEAKSLAEEMMANFRHPEWGFFDTRDDHERLLFRPKDVQDNAFPSGNALAATALLQLSAYELNMDWRTIAEEMLSKMGENLSRYPTGFGQWLCTADFALGPVQEVAILGDPESNRTKDLVDSVWEQYRPRLVAAHAQITDKSQGPKLLHDRKLINNQPTAYVCQGFICRQPVNDSQELSNQLSPESDIS